MSQSKVVQKPIDPDGKEAKLTCTICHHHCQLNHGQLGICGVRRRQGESIDSLVYGRVIAEHVDPIEKKPVFHVLPGSLSYSIATPGCNFTCLHCQNSSISQVKRGADFSRIPLRSPEAVVDSAVAGGCSSISYTYVEPTVFFEFALDCCLAAMDRGLINIFVSNGYMSGETLSRLAPCVSAINIDLKAFSESFYRRICGAQLGPVQDTIRHCAELGIWLEITTLVIPGLNDSDRELSEIASFISLMDVNIPWHVSGFYPAHNMRTTMPTPPATLARARQIGLDMGLSHVYTGNCPGSGGENSYCSSCGAELIRRRGFRVVTNHLVSGCCPHCRTRMSGVWE